MAGKREQAAAHQLVPGAPNDGDRIRLTTLAAERLASLSGLEAKELEGRTIAELGDKLRWIIDPEWLLFRRVCGRVVKTDPVTGIQYPVPFATVHVLDTDCDFWGYFPPDWVLGWLFPIRCHTEELTRVVTDECGNFCVWIPRFDLDWVLRWRRERFCFEDVLVKPSLGDLLERLAHEALQRQPFPPQPNPPDPWELVSDVATRPDVAHLVGPRLQESLLASAETAVFGASAAPMLGALSAPAFARPVEPPLPHTLKRRFSEVGSEALGEHLEAGSTRLEGLDLHRWHGPFLRCVDIWVREWEPVFDVPDVSFEVTQDVDGDGDDDVVYRSYFDLSHGGTDPNVTIEAWPIAVALPSPHCGPSFDCDGDPAIQRIGLHPVKDASAYFDEGNGFAVRPNRARSTGLFGGPQVSPSTAPMFGELQVYGCNHGAKAAYYRVLGAQAAGSGLPSTPSSFGPQLPIFASWKLARWAPGFQQHTVSPDASGWYPILDDSDGWQPEHLLLDWIPGGAAVWQLTLQLADGGHAVVHEADPLLLVVDNEAPVPSFPGVFRWRTASSGWTNLSTTCPLIERTTSEEVLIEIGAAVTAKHLRSAKLTAGGCGLTLEATTATGSGHDPVTEHWYDGPNDNAWSTVATYRVPADARPGCYTFAFHLDSRAFNPAGGDGGFAADWNYDSPWVPSAHPQISIAIVGP